MFYLPISPIAKASEAEGQGTNHAIEVVIVKGTISADAIDIAVASSCADLEEAEDIEFQAQLWGDDEDAIVVVRPAVVEFDANAAPAQFDAAEEVEEFVLFVGEAQPEATVADVEAKVIAIAIEELFGDIGSAEAIATEEKVIDDQAAAAADGRSGFAVVATDFDNGAAEGPNDASFAKEGFLLLSQEITANSEYEK